MVVDDWLVGLYLGRVHPKAHIVFWLQEEIYKAHILEAFSD